MGSQILDPSDEPEARSCFPALYPSYWYSAHDSMDILWVQSRAHLQALRKRLLSKQPSTPAMQLNTGEVRHNSTTNTEKQIAKEFTNWCFMHISWLVTNMLAAANKYISSLGEHQNGATKLGLSRAKALGEQEGTITCHHPTLCRCGREKPRGRNQFTNNRKRIRLPKQHIHPLQCRNVNPSLLVSVFLPWHFLSFPVILTDYSLSVILFILIKKSVMRTKSRESNVDSKLKRNSHGQIISVLCQHD